MFELKHVIESTTLNSLNCCAVSGAYVVDMDGLHDSLLSICHRSQTPSHCTNINLLFCLYLFIWKLFFPLPLLCLVQPFYDIVGLFVIRGTSGIYDPPRVERHTGQSLSNRWSSSLSHSRTSCMLQMTCSSSSPLVTWWCQGDETCKRVSRCEIFCVKKDKRNQPPPTMPQKPSHCPTIHQIRRILCCDPLPTLAWGIFLCFFPGRGHKRPGKIV